MTYTSEVTGAEAPAKSPEQIAADAAAVARTQVHAPAPQTTEEAVTAATDPSAKALADTKAELTRVQQELARIKKGEQPPKADDKATEQPPKVDDKVPQPGTTEAEKAAADVVAKSGLDVSAWQAEFTQTGDVSEQGREQIAKSLEAQFGQDARNLVDSFIEGQKVRATNYKSEVVKIAGGEEQYGEMLKWASTSLNEAEKTAYNRAVDSFDLTSATLAVDGLKARFARERGQDPQLITGNNAITQNNQGFASTFEMTKAMGDPRYGKDPVYTKSVEQRAMKSNF